MDQEQGLINAERSYNGCEINPLVLVLMRVNWS